MELSNKIRLIVLFFLLFGCENKESKAINSYRLPKPELAQSDPRIIQNTDLFSWNVPDDWMQINTSEFSKANYLVTSFGGSAEVSISYFEGSAGGIEANVNRWRRQLGLEELGAKEIDLLGKSLLSQIGDYKIYKLTNPNNDDLGFLCSVIPAKNQTIFIKLKTYPKIIDNFEKEFIEFCSSFNYNE